MDEIEQRLRETSENCFNCYEAWRKDVKNGAARVALQESVHELRKVASRLEIELAVSERDEMRKTPIPIPPHRDATRRAPEMDDDQSGGNNFNTAQGHAQSHHPGNNPRGDRGQGQRPPMHRRRPPRNMEGQ